MRAPGRCEGTKVPGIGVRPQSGTRASLAAEDSSCTPCDLRVSPVPSVSRNAGRRQDLGLTPGACLDGHSRTDKCGEKEGTELLRAVLGARPRCSAPAPLPAFPRPGWGPPAGAQLPPPSRQMGRGVNTVIASPDRVAVAAHLLPAGSRTGTTSPGLDGVTDPVVWGEPAGTRGGGRTRVPARAMWDGFFPGASRCSGESVSLAYFASAGVIYV